MNSLKKHFLIALFAIAGWSGLFAQDAGTDRDVACDQAVLNATPLSIGTWSTAVVGVTFDLNTDPGTTVRNLQPGPNELIWTTATTTTTVTITRYVADAGLDQPNNALCASAVLDATSTPIPGIWITGTPGVTFVDATDPATTANNIPAGSSTTFTWTIESSAGCNSLATVNITNNTPSATTGADRETCTNNQVLLGGNAPSAGYQGLWVQTSGGAHSFADNTLYNTLVTGLDLGDHNFRWRLTHTASGCSDFEDVLIDNNTVTPNATDVITCNQNVNLTADNPLNPGESGLWTSAAAISAGITIDNPTNPITLIRSLDPGDSYIFNWELTNSSCVDDIDITVTRNTSAVDAGPDQYACEDVLGGLDATFTMNASDPGAGTGTWSRTSGTGAYSISNVNDRFATITVAPGAHTFRWRVVGALVCNGNDNVVLYNDQPTPSDAGAPQSDCDGTVTLAGNAPQAGETGAWTAVPAGIVFTNSALYNTQASNLSHGLNTFTWTISKGACTSESDVEITYDFLPGITAGGDQVLCTNTTTMIGATVPAGTATGMWSIVQGGGTFTNPTAFNTTVTSIPRRDNIYRWTVTEGTCSASADVTISNYSVTANAGLDNYTCDGTYTLLGNTPASQNITIPNIPATGTWTHLGPANITDVNLYNTYVDNLDLDDNTFTWTMTNGFCTSLSDDVVISNDMPTIPDAGLDDIFCGIDFDENGEGYTEEYNSLNGNAVDGVRGETGVWTLVAGQATFVDPTSTANARVTNLGHYSQLTGPDYWNQNPTVNTFRWTITNKACSLYDDVSIVNAAPFAANAGPDQTVCYDEANLNAIDHGSGAQIHVWTQLNPIPIGDPLVDANIANPNDFNSYVSNLQSLATTFRWTKENTLTFAGTTLTCTIYDDAVITRPPVNLGRPNAGPNQILCSEEGDMAASPADYGFTLTPPESVSGQWAPLLGNGNFADATNPSTHVTNLAYRTNIFRWTVTYDDGAGFQCISTDDVDITNALPSNANAGPDQYVCTNTALLSSDRPTRGTGEWSVIGGGGTISNTTCQDFSCNVYVSSMGYGENTFRWTMSNSYTDPASLATKTCTLTDEITVWNYEITANAGIDQIVCIDEATITANQPSGTTGIWDVTGGGGNVTIPTSSLTTVTNLSPNINTLRWTLDNGFCSAEDYIVITNNNPENPSAGADQIVCSDNATLVANTPVVGMGNGVWSVQLGGGVIASSLSATTAVNNIPVGQNTYRWTITKGACPEYDDVDIYNNSVIALAGTDIDNVCGTEFRNSTVILNATPPNLALGETGNWTVFNSFGAIQTPSAFDSDVDGMDRGENIFRWTLSNTRGAVTCTDDDFVSVFVYIPTTAAAGANQTSCWSPTNILTLTGNNPVHGSGTWTILPGGGGNIFNPTNFTTSVDNLAQDQTIFRWSIVDNPSCPASTSDVLITNNYVFANAGPDQAVCNGTATLAATDPDVFNNGFEVASGSWIVVQGLATFDSPTRYNAVVTGLDNTQANRLQWTITKGACSATDEVSIENNFFTVTAGIDQTVCDNFTNLNGEQPGAGESGVWTVQSGGGNFVDASLYNTEVNNLNVGLNIFRWTVSNSTCSAFADVEIHYNQVIANAGIQDRVCNTSNYILGANDPSPASGNWVTLIGGASVTTPSLNTSGVTNLAQGQNTFQWTVSRTVNTVTCNDVSTVNIFNDTPDAALVEADNAVCSNNTVITVTVPPTIGSGIWTADKAVTYDNPSSFNANVSNLVRGATTFTWTVTNNGCSLTDNVVITNNSVVANAGLDRLTSCSADVTLSGNNPILTQGTGVWVDFSGSGATIDDPTLYNTSVTGLVQGTTQFQWTVSLGACVASDIVDVTNNQITAIAGLDQTTCNDSYGPLDGNDVSGVGGTGVWTSIGESALITNSLLFNSGVTGLDPGLNTFRWTVTSAAEGCTHYDEVGITNNGVTANAGADVETCFSTISLSATQPSKGTGLWTQSSGNPAAIADNTSLTSQISGLTGGVYAFTWTVTEGACSDADDVIITNSTPSAANPSTSSPEICNNANASLNANALLVGETGLWTKVDAGGTILTPSNPNTTVSNLQLGDNTFRWTLYKGTNITCTSSGDVVVVNNTVVANAGADDNICATTTNLQGNNPIDTQGSGTWTKIGINPATIVNSTSYNTQITGLADNTTHGFSWTVTQGTCSASDDVYITNDNVLAIAGSNQSTCNNSINLDGNDVSSTGATGLWTRQVGSTANIVNSSVYNTLVTDLVPGLNRFTWTVTSGGGCISPSTVDITYNYVTANAGADKETCFATISLSATTPTNGSGLWTQSGGNPAAIVDNTSNISQINGLTGGNYTFTWTVTSGICSASDDVIITNSTPSAANPSTSSPEICNNANASLNANALLVGETGLWTKVDAGGTILTPSNPNTTVSNLQLGDNTFRWTLYKGTNITCTSSGVVLVVNNTVVANAGADDNICATTTNLQGNNPIDTQGSGTWTKIGINPATIVNSTSYNTQITGLADNTTHGFTWTVTQGTCSASDDVYITNDNVLADAGSDQSTCNNSINLDGNDVSSAGATGIWTKTPSTSTANIVNPSVFNTLVTDLEPGINLFTWTVTSSAGCVNSSDVEITYNYISADAGLDQEICTPTATLGATGTGYWTQIAGPAAVFTDSTDPNTTTTGLTSGNYVFQWNVLFNGCPATDNVLIVNNSPQDVTANTSTPEICGGLASLSGTTPILGETGRWSMVDATGVFTNSAADVTDVSGLKPGVNIFRWTLTKGTANCKDYADVTVVNNQVTANAFTSNSISCNGTTTITGNDPTLQSTPGYPATGLWTVSTGATISNTTYYDNVSATNLAQGDNIFTWTVSKGTCSKQATVTVTNAQVFATTGGNIPICGENVTLNGADPAPNTGVWTLEGGVDIGAINIVSPSAYNSNVTGIAKSAIFKWTVTGANCYDEAFVTVNNNSIDVNDGALLTICAYNGTGSLNAGSLEPGQTGVWTSAGTNPVIADPTNILTAVSNLDYGNNIFFWTVSNPTGCSGQGRYEIVNDAPTPPNAGVDQNLCASITTLSGNNPLYGSGLWTSEGGSTFIVISDPTSSSTVVSGLGQGASTFRWTITNNLCFRSDDVIINNNLFNVQVGNDFAICNNSANLSVVVGAPGIWTRTSGSGIIANSSDPATAVSNLSFGENKFLWTVDNGNCIVSDEMSITVNTPEIPVTEVDKIVCDYDNVSISANAPSYGTGIWVPQGGTATVANPTNNITTVSNLTNGANTIRWILSYNGCDLHDDLVITSNAVTADAGSSQTLCADNTSLSAAPPGIGVGSWSVTSGAAIIVNSLDRESAVSNLGQGSNILRWTVTNVGCSEFDEVVITNDLPDLPDAGTDINTCNNSVSLTGNNPAIGNGVWSTLSGTASISEPTLYNTSVTVTSGVTTFTWTITNNSCTLSDDVLVSNDSFTVNVNPDNTTCDGTFDLLGTNPADVGTGTGTGQWSVISGSGTFDNSLSGTTTVRNLLATGSRESIFRWTIIDGLCSDSDVVKITNDQVSASVTGFMTCNSTQNILGNDPSTQNASGLWTVDNQTTQVIANPTYFNTSVSGLVANAINRIRWTVSRNSCSATDTMRLEYYVPNANITIPDIAHGCADTVQLIADSNIGTGVGVWTESTGSVAITFDNNTMATTIARNLPITNNTFIWTVTNRGCVSSDQIVINNSKPINTAGTDKAGCTNTFTMNAQVPTATGSGVWSLISGNVAFGNANSASTIVTADPGTNIIDWTITDNGCSATKRFNVANNLTSPNAGTDVSVCQNSVNLAGNILKTGETGVWSIDGGIVSETFSSTTINNPLVSNLRQGNITFVWTVSNGTCSAEDRVVITNNTPFVDAGPDLTICEDFVTLNGNNPDAGKGESGLWTIGNTNVQIANPTFYNTTVTNLGQGSNLFKWTVSNTNCTTFDEVAITSNAIDVVAGLPYSEGCAVTLNLEATQPPVGTTGIWTAVDGGGPFDNASSYATTVRNLQPYNKLRWTISDGTCSFYDEIEYVSLAPTQANAGKDTAVCANFIQITANPASGIGESGLWSKVGGSTAVTIATPTSFQTMVNNLDPGPNNFRWTISNASCSTSDMVTVTNNEVFSDAGQDQVICTENYAISANVITGTGVWTSSTPGTVIASSTSENTNVSNLAFGDNKFTWTVTYNGCTDDDEVIIRSDLPRNVSAGSDQNICSASTNLAGTNPGSGTGIWEVTGGAGTFASATANQTTVSGISSGENIYKWTVTVGTCSASSQVRVNNNSLYVTAGTDQTLCNQDTLVLDGTIPDPGITGTWSVNGGTGIFDNSTQNNSVVRNITKGSNTYRWTLTDGSCTNYADVKVINNTPDLAVVGADQQICTDNAIINAIAVTNGTGLWSRKSGSGTITSPSSNNTTVTGINVGLNTYTWTVTKNGCSLSDDINITNNSVSAYIADDDITICTPTHTATIIGNAVGTGETGFWAKISAGPGIITASTSNVTTVTNLGNGETYFRWTVANGLCSNSDDLKITNNYYNTTANPAGPSTLCVDYSTVIGGSLPVGATGKWSSTAPDVTFDNNTLVSTIARNLPGGTSAITWTVTKDGCSSPASFNLLNNAIYTSAGANQVVCDTITTLNAQGILSGESGYWTVNNANVRISDSTNPATSVEGLIIGDNTFTWTLNGNGCSVSDQMIVSNNSFDVVAGVNQISCGPSYTLRGSDPLVGTGLWTIASGTGRFITPTNFETLVEDMNNGPNTFTWTVNRNGCVASANVTITNDLYIAVTGDDRSICSNQTTVSAQPLNATWGASGMWTAQTGGGIFTDPTSASNLVSGLSTGDNRLRWTVTKGSCVSYDEITITNNSITASAGTDETTCDNFAMLSATPLSATGVGLWTGGGVAVSIVTPTSANTSVINLQAGVNTFAWTVTDKGCTGTSTVRVTSNYFTARAGNDQILTSDFATMTAKLPSGATGSWSTFSGNGAFTSISDPTTLVTGLGYGVNTFRWTVTLNSCSSFDDVNITYNAVTADAGMDTTICADNIYLSAEDPFPGSGRWTVVGGGGTFVDAFNRFTQVTGILPGSTNIYRWTVSISGYSEYDDVVVSNGEFRTSAGADRASCNNFTTLAAASPGSGIGAWTILAGSGNFTDPSSNNTAVTNLGDTPNLFVWTVTKPTGCVDSDTVQVIYNVPPTASFTATPSTGCSPIDVTYQNNSTDGSSYYWNYGESQDWDYSLEDTTIQYIAYDNDSVYTTTLIAYSNAGCSDTISRTITAYGIPKVAINAYPLNQLYPDATVFVENNSGDGYPNYYWTFGDTETQLDYSRIPQIQHTYATWGTYEITLAVTSTTCSDTARATINILAPKPTDFSSRNYYSGCQPQTVSLTAATDYADSYEWFIVDSRGDTIETSIDQNPSIIFTEAGRYYARIRATGPGGTVDVRTDTIDVFNVPEVDFIITPDTVMLPNQPIHCYNRSTYGDRYEWDFGDTSKVSFEENPLHYYTKEGIYPVTLRVYTENGCFNSKTTDVGIVVEKPGVCRFPNAFTPSISGSSDGHYDPDAVNNVVFHPVHRGIREYKLEIFNRWGEKLFESTDPTIGWDGYANGKLAPQDVYVWKVTGKFKNGVIFKDAGDVTLLR